MASLRVGPEIPMKTQELPKTGYFPIVGYLEGGLKWPYFGLSGRSPPKNRSIKIRFKP